MAGCGDLGLEERTYLKEFSVYIVFFNWFMEWLKLFSNWETSFVREMSNHRLISGWYLIVITIIQNIAKSTKHNSTYRHWSQPVRSALLELRSLWNSVWSDKVIHDVVPTCSLCQGCLVDFNYKTNIQAYSRISAEYNEQIIRYYYQLTITPPNWSWYRDSKNMHHRF